MVAALPGVFPDNKPAGDNSKIAGVVHIGLHVRVKFVRHFVNAPLTKRFQAFH